MILLEARSRAGKGHTVSWSYTPDLLATSPLMQVRLLIGDINEDTPLMQDEEIDYFLTQSAGSYYAAARCCDVLYSRYVQKDSVTVGPLTVNEREKATDFMNLAKILRNRAAMEGGTVPNWGGNSIAEKIAVSEDEDRIGTAARVDGDANPPLDSGQRWRYR